MDMTPEQLDEARAREAVGLWRTDSRLSTHQELAAIAARLAREGWTPTDPDLIEAREVVAKLYDGRRYVHLPDQVRGGGEDDTSQVQCALAAIKRGRELAAKP